MIAGRRSKTVAFVVTLALTTFGALAPASPPTFDLPPAFGTPRGVSTVAATLKSLAETMGGGLGAAYRTAYGSSPAVLANVAQMAPAETVNLRFPADWADAAVEPVSRMLALASADSRIDLFSPKPTYSITNEPVAAADQRRVEPGSHPADMKAYHHALGKKGTAAIALRDVANLAVSARKGAHEAFEVAQLATQSSVAAAIQQMSTRFAYRSQKTNFASTSGTIYGDEPGRPLIAEEVPTLLDANEALVFFLVGANESYVFALTREGFEWRTLSLGEESVSAKVAAFRRGLDVVELTKSISMGEAQLFDLAAAHELYVALFGPIEALIKHKPQLLIVPSGPLTALPFHLLVVDKPVIIGPQMQINEMAAYRDAAWLVKRHAVTVLPSVANLKALRVSARKGQGTKPMIGFGDPVFAPDKVAALAGQRTARVKIAARTRAYSEYWQGASVNRAKLAEALAPLPDSADELKAVAAKLGAPASDIYLGRNATEANVKRLPLADYRVVYFATHGLVAGDVEGLGEPSLALTLPNEPSELDDGLLTASEVAQLELNADWVVLSACNTAAGEKPGAEALSGLARAFFYAGARALLVSHWGIDSKAAVRLATSTFDIMNSDRTIGRAEALRRAMLIYLDDRSDIWNAYPAFWGSFSLVGDGRVPDAAAVAAAPRRAAAVASAQPVDVYVKTVKTVSVLPTTCDMTIGAGGRANPSTMGC